MKKSEHGAIIVEATLVLPMFMFAIITVLFVVNICFAQAKIGAALNETAKEISQYSYVIGLTGVEKKQQELYNAGSNARESIDKMADGIGDLFSSASSISGTVQSTGTNITEFGEAYNSISQDFEKGKSGVTSTIEGGKALVSDPMSIMKMAANEGIEYLKSYLAKYIVPVFIQKNLVRSEDDDPELFLKSLGVVPDGNSYIGGLHFEKSVFFLNGSEEIKIIADYDIKVIRLLGIDVTMHFTQCGATKAWFEGAGSDIVNEDPSGTTETPEGEEESFEAGEEESTAEEETTESDLHTAEQYAQMATHNASSPQVVLGKFDNGLTGESYIDTAIYYEATYFDMDDYDEVKEKTSSDFMWEINQKFLEQQQAQNKQFLLASDPSAATGTFGKEVDWLKKQGYTFEFVAGQGIWKAEKK